MNEESETGGSETGGSAYAGKVGQRLRAIRRQKRLSLHEVEAGSGEEFKASVLGAYERGERVISVPRLHRLADFYNVPVDQLLPRENAADIAVAATEAQHRGPQEEEGVAPAKPLPRKITFDLARFEAIADDPELEMVFKYLSSIQVRRQDFNGRVLTIRADDIRAIAGLFGTDPDALVRRLDNLRLRLQPA